MLIQVSQANSEHSQTNKIRILPKTVNGVKLILKLISYGQLI